MYWYCKLGCFSLRLIFIHVHYEIKWIEILFIENVQYSTLSAVCMKTKRSIYGTFLSFCYLLAVPMYKYIYYPVRSCCIYKCKLLYDYVVCLSCLIIFSVFLQLQMIINFALIKTDHIPQCWIFHNCAVVTTMAFIPLFPIILLKNLSPLQFTSTIR